MTTYMNVVKILQEGDGDSALAALSEARGLCKEGKMIELIDYLCPDDKPKRLPMSRWSHYTRINPEDNQ